VRQVIFGDATAAIQTRTAAFSSKTACEANSCSSRRRSSVGETNSKAINLPKQEGKGRPAGSGKSAKQSFRAARVNVTSSFPLSIKFYQLDFAGQWTRPQGGHRSGSRAHRTNTRDANAGGETTLSWEGLYGYCVLPYDEWWLAHIAGPGRCRAR
jgi:hypothetical protein